MKIKIYEIDGKFKIYVTNLNLSSKYVEERNITEINKEIEKFLNKIKIKTKGYDKKDWLSSFVVVLFDSMHCLTREIGIIGKIPKQIYQKIKN